MLTKFFHHLFNPHCIECKEEHSCKSCETLREQLAAERYEKKQLLEMLFPRPQTELKDEEDYKPLKPKYIPWNMRKQLLEREDREKAKILKNQELEKKSIEQLEKELSIEVPDNAS